LETQQLSLDLLQLDAELAALTGEARPLLGLPSSETITFTGALPEATLPDHPGPDLTSRPEYQAALARSEAARQNVALAKANRWEDASIGVSAELDRANDAPDGLQTDGLIGLRFSLPLPFWNKNEGKIEEAEATAARTGKEADALAANVRAEAAAALGEMTAARRIMDETGKNLLPKAREIEAKFTAFHQQSQPGIQLADVLRAREKRLAIEQAALDALRTFHLARIRFLAAMGQ
jgi:cobalt-zinc-cadmium efflux system outer membrane protein